MTQIEFLSKNVYFTTRQYAFLLNSTIETASRRLVALAKNKSIAKVTRGIWCQPHHPFFSPYGAVPYILAKEQGYISFLTALHRHGVISQIPSNIQIATTGHSRILKSEIGEFELFHIQPNLMKQGIKLSEGKLMYQLASAEKALLDTIYLSTRKNRRFAKLPEIEISVIKKNELKKLIRQTPLSVQKLIKEKIVF